MYPIEDDKQFAYELLAEQKVLIVQGTGFNWADRITCASCSCRTRTTSPMRSAHREVPRALPQAPFAARRADAARGVVSRADRRSDDLSFFLRRTMNPIQVGLLGIGTVGSGTFEVLRRNQAEIQRRAGRSIRIAMVADLDTARARRIVGDSAEVVADARSVIAKPAIDIVVELIGGVGIARTLVLEAIAPASTSSPPTRRCWRCTDRDLRRRGGARVVVAFEAAVAGGIPDHQGAARRADGNRIDWIVGIVNGTTNFILSEMRAKGLDFATALAQAQQLGYAEPTRHSTSPASMRAQGDDHERDRVRDSGPLRPRARRGHRRPAGGRHRLCRAARLPHQAARDHEAARRPGAPNDASPSPAASSCGSTRRWSRRRA
jgi:hypothetical protein